MPTRPHLSYTVWFSQRTGSTLLCDALAGSGLAGRPGERFHEVEPAALRAHHGADSPAQLQEKLWALGSTPNGVFGLKHGIYEPRFTEVLALLGQFPGGERLDPGNRPGIWENAFPNHRHIFMTRRNKVRLAVSWWKAIQTGEWHRRHGAPPAAVDVAGRYRFEAIDHLVAESTLREAGTQEFFAEAGIVPWTVTYEDFVLDYEGTVRAILWVLGQSDEGVEIPPPRFERLADEVSEEWVQRFRREKQDGWGHAGW